MCGPSIMFRNGTPVLLTASCPLGQKLVCSCAMTLELTDPTARGPFHVMLLPFCGDLWGYAAADLSIAQLLLVCPQQSLTLSGSSPTATCASRDEASRAHECPAWGWFGIKSFSVPSGKHLYFRCLQTWS